MKRATLLIFSPLALIANATGGAAPQYALVIGGTGAGYLGDYKNETFTPTGLSGGQRKQKTGSITIEAGPTMSPKFYQWLGKALAAQEVGPPIAIDTLGPNGVISSELRIGRPQIESITIPNLNSKSREMGALRVKMIPFGAAQLGSPSKPYSFEPGGSVQWGKKYFKLTIPGINTSHLTKVEGFTINPAEPNPKNLTITISGDAMMDFLKMKGAKSGTLQVTADTGPLFEVDIRGLEVANYSGLASATVKLSCKQVLIRFGL